MKKKEMCFKSTVKREGMIDGDDSVDPTCVGW